MKACATFLPLFTIIVKMFHKRKKKKAGCQVTKPWYVWIWDCDLQQVQCDFVPKGMILVDENMRKHLFQEARWNYKHFVLDTSD